MSEYLVGRIRADRQHRGSHAHRGRLGCAATDTSEHHARAIGTRGETEDVGTSWLFVFIGALPRDRLARRRDRPRRQGLHHDRPGPGGLAEAARWPLARSPYALETSVPGVFAAGDVRLDSMKRVASAVGEGAMSVYLVHRYLATTDDHGRRLEELRAMALFDGLSDAAAARSSGPQAPSETFAAGDVLFRERQPADHWWLLLEGDIALVRRVGQRGDDARPHGDARPVGRRIPGLGRARGLHGDRAGGVGGRHARVPADGARRAGARLVRLRRAPHDGLVATARGSSPPRANARPWSRSGRCRRVSRTSSTTRRRRRPGRRGAARHQRRPAGVLARAWPPRDHRRHSSSSSTRCGGDRPPAGDLGRARPSPTARTSSATG